jgi:hypothetical protein
MIAEQGIYPDAVAAIVDQLVKGNRVTAERAVADISYIRQDVPGGALPRPLKVRVFRRDCWTCRYCGGRTIFYPVMALLASPSTSRPGTGWPTPIHCCRKSLGSQLTRPTRRGSERSARNVRPSPRTRTMSSPSKSSAADPATRPERHER